MFIGSTLKYWEMGCCQTLHIFANFNIIILNCKGEHLIFISFVVCFSFIYSAHFSISTSYFLIYLIPFCISEINCLSIHCKYFYSVYFLSSDFIVYLETWYTKKYWGFFFWIYSFHVLFWKVLSEIIRNIFWNHMESCFILELCYYYLSKWNLSHYKVWDKNPSLLIFQKKLVNCLNKIYWLIHFIPAYLEYTELPWTCFWLSLFFSIIWSILGLLPNWYIIDLVLPHYFSLNFLVIFTYLFLWQF